MMKATVLLPLFFVGVLSLLIAAVPIDTAAQPASPGAVGQERIQITADRLESSRQKSYAEFAGNVEVVQNQFRIEADRLRVYYKQGLESKNPAASKDAIEKIVALGNVKIKTETATAETDQAEYWVQKMVFSLIGENSTVVSGKNSITGAQITFNQRDGSIRVEGQEGKRVRAVFYPDDKTLTNPQGTIGIGAPGAATTPAEGKDPAPGQSK